MDKIAVAAFARSMAYSLKDIYGSPITLNGVDYVAAVSVGTPEYNLETGGFEKPVDFTVRIPRDDMPAPVPTGSPVIIDGKNYRLLSTARSFGALSQEWILEVGTA